MQEDTEYRSNDPAARGAARLAAQPRLNPPAQSPPAATPGRRGDAFDPTQQPNAPGAPQTLGSMGAPGAAPAGEGGIPAQSPRSPGGAVVATLPPSQTPKDEFDLAYGYVLRREYALAEDGFRSFLSKYPNDRLTGDATYWFGESLFQRHRFRDAAEAFLNVSTKFESNPKAPDALLRLGQSLAALGEREAACASLGEVLRKFPRASANVNRGSSENRSVSAADAARPISAREAKHLFQPLVQARALPRCLGQIAEQRFGVAPVGGALASGAEERPKTARGHH